MACFVAPDAKCMRFLLDVDECSMIFFHLWERKLPCEGLGPAFGMDKTCIQALGAIRTEVSLQPRSHPHQLHDCCSGLGSGLLPTYVTHRMRDKSSEKGTPLWVQLSSSGNSDTEAHVLSQVCSLCASLLTAPSTVLGGLVGSAVHFPSNIQDAGLCHR